MPSMAVRRASTSAGVDRLRAGRDEAHAHGGAAEHQARRLPQRRVDRPLGALGHLPAWADRPVTTQDVLVVHDELDGVDERVDPLDPRRRPPRRPGAHGGDQRFPVALRHSPLTPLQPSGQGREHDAGREVGAALSHDEVRGEVAGTPRVAEGGRVRTELEEGVAQGLALGLHHRQMGFRRHDGHCRPRSRVPGATPPVRSSKVVRCPARSRPSDLGFAG